MMGDNNTEGICIDFVLEHWASEAGVRLCNKLDMLISELSEEILNKNLNHLKTQHMLYQFLLLRIKSSDCHEISLSTACKTLISKVVSSVLLCSTNERQTNCQLLEILKLSLESVIIAKEDEFCLNLITLITQNVLSTGECQIQQCKTLASLSVMECMLNAFISVEMRLNHKNLSSTVTFLQSDSFHRTVAEFALKCGEQTILSYMLFTIVPKLVEVSRDHTVLNILWMEMNSSKSTDRISLSIKLFILCGLADLLISKGSGGFFVIKSNQFWELIQEGLVSDDALLRKKGLYLLKRSVDVVVMLNLQLDLELFSWNCLISESLQHFWEKVFILLEVLEEKQAHLVVPVLQSALKLSQDFTVAHPSWLLLIYERLLSHDSLQVIKLGILYFFKVKIDLYVNCSYKCIIEVLFQKLNNMLLFSCNTSVIGWSVMDTALKEWLTCVLLNSNICVEFFSIIVDAMVKIQWCTIPLFHILHNMSVIPASNIFDERKLAILCSFLKEAVRTHNVFVRGAVQCALLKIIIQYTKKNINLLHIANTLGVFRQNECLHRGLETWEITKEWIRSCILLEGSENISQLLLTETNLSLESKARSMVLFFDSGLVDINSKFQVVVNEYFSVLKDTHIRPYASVDESDKCLELILHILEESRNFSAELDFRNNDLIISFAPYIKEIIPYIKKRLFDKDELVYFDNVELYVETLQILSDSGLVSLVEGRKLNKLAEEVSLSSEYHPLQRYFGLKVTLWYIQFEIKKKDEYCMEENIKSYVLSVIKDGHLVSKLRKDSMDEELSGKHSINWGRLISGHTYTLWSILQQCVIANFVSLRDILSVISAEDLIEMATNSIESGGRESLVPILGVGKFVLPYIMKNIELSQRFLEFTWKSCFELRKVAVFWPSIKSWVEMTFSKKIIMEKGIQTMVVNFADKILAQGEAVSGLSNVLITHLRLEIKDIKCALPLLQTLTSALLFGPVLRRDQRIENDTCALIRSLGSDYAVNDLIPQSGCLVNHEVRVGALAILMGAEARVEDILVDVVRRLLARDAQLSAQRQRYHGDSLHHRLKHRILQALLVLEAILAESPSPLAKSCVVELVKWSSASLQGESQQPSVRYQLEWLLVRSLLHSPDLLANFWTMFNQASEERTGSVCSFISVAYHLALSLRERAFVERCVTEILPWCMAQHFNVRLYSQVVLQKLWPLDSEVASKYEAVRNSLTKSLNQGNAVRNADKLKNDFYFTAFHPVGHFSLETIFWELPRLANISRDELVPLSALGQCFEGLRSSVPLTNRDDSLTSFTAATWVVKATAESEVEVEACALQKKFMPWKSMFPELETSSKSTSCTELVVVASLIDKLPNLGGLARTCEIFAAQCLVVASLEHTRDQLFSTLSMSAEKHINIVEVKPHDLPQYLKEKKVSGYTLVGAEQTAASESLDTYKFPKKCILLLGNEKEGIPVNFLPLLDVCVEVRQLGVVRSLNVHVTGALFVWEYTRQHLGKPYSQC